MAAPVNLADAVRATIKQTANDLMGRTASLRDAEGPFAANSDYAVERFRKRAAAMRMSDQDTDAAIQRGHSGIARAQSLMESPIERLLLPWLVFEDYGLFLTAPAIVHNPKVDHSVPPGDIVIVPQFAFIRYRVDFAIIGRYGGQQKIVAVECDGSEFHDVTKDKERDAYLASWGISTIRADGTTIHQHPLSVTAKAAELFHEWVGG